MSDKPLCFAGWTYRQVFASNLRRLRHANGLSQEELAYEAEVNRTMATGRHSPAPWLCAATLLVVFGCATSRPDWTKPGATSADLRRDLADCERQATGPPLFHFRASNEDYETARDRIGRVKYRCMTARGWRLVSAN